MEQILALAARQFGLFTRKQWLSAGLTARQLDYQLSTAGFAKIHPGVYGVRGSPRSFEREVLAACLAVDGVASHRCAAYLWRFRRFERPVVEVLVRKDHTPAVPGIKVRRTAYLEPVDRTVIGRIPVTMRARTLLDIAGEVPQLTEGAIDGTLHRRQVKLPALEAVPERVGKRHPGRALFERLVAERVAGRRPTESELEDDFLNLVIRAHGLPEPVPQHPVGRRRIDFAYPEIVFGIEIDSVAAHAAREDVQRNAEKANDLLGWRILHFTHEDVHTRPAETAARVLKEVEVRRRRAA